jgi:hypothetical protein
MHSLVEINLLRASSFNSTKRSGRQPRVAVMVRSHVVDDKFFELYETLTSGAIDYDLFAALDETHGRPELAVDNVMWHSAQKCMELGLSQQHPSLLWLCGDFPFYFALRDLSQYDYYIMLEFDVHLLSKDATFIGSLVRKLEHAPTGSIDMLGLGFGKPRPDWMWFATAHATYSDVRCMYFPFVVLSRRASSYMYSQRQVEASRQPMASEIMHCEAFTASSLQTGGFNCFDLNDFMPGSYSRPHMSMPGGGYMGQDFDVQYGLQMVHPVYTPRSYLERLIKNVFDGKMERSAFIELLNSRQCVKLPNDIRSEFMRAVDTTSLASRQSAGSDRE